MDDLTITRLCAMAMGLRFRVKENGIGNDDVSLDGVDLYDEGSNMWNRCYSPLTDDAQAMALVKKFRLDIKTLFSFESDDDKKKWWTIRGTVARWEVERHDDLNRAICECVAKMQQERK